MDLKEMMWQGAPNALSAARGEALELKKSGRVSSAHSLMLSAYLSVAASVPSWKKVFYFFCALRHALMLKERSIGLTHNQLDVLVQFFIKLHERSKILFRLCGVSENLMFTLADLGLARAKTSLSSKPHQVALAYMTCAEVYKRFEPLHSFHNKPPWFTFSNTALRMEKEIFKEEPRLQALRQWVRILRKAGELYSRKDPVQAYEYIKKALVLAKGEANTQDQVQKILLRMKEIENLVAQRQK